MSNHAGETGFDPAYGRPVEVGPDIVRLTAPNASQMTYRGTNTYILGAERCVIVDPGPAIPEHLDAIEAALDGRACEAILLTHRHLDHVALADAAAERFGAPLMAAPPSAPASPSRPQRALWRELRDGECLDLAGTRIEIVATPGHTGDHLAFALAGTGILLSGDHVMGWSTSVVIPPDGSMRAYMASLEKLLDRNDEFYLPGHGAAVREPAALVRGMLYHRRAREATVLSRLEMGPMTVEELVTALYPRLDGDLRRAAGFSVLAHLIALEEGDEVRRVEGVTGLDPRFARR